MSEFTYRDTITGRTITVDTLADDPSADLRAANSGAPPEVQRVIEDLVTKLTRQEHPEVSEELAYLSLDEPEQS